jgi:N-acetylmuramoyl-L-alanine amidase
MENPYRIVIDVTGTRKAIQPPPPPAGGGRPPSTTGGPTLASAFGLKVRTIVIDPGHGGKDPGCNYSGLKEKDIVLDIAKELRTLLQKDKSLKVYLTREKDVYLPLEERTAIANKYKADLFISIHINAAPNKSASGIETYVLNVTNDASALEVAAFENKATTKSISDLQGILKDLMLNSKLEESLNLAYAVQKNLASALKLTKAQNLGVKQAPFYVLVGAQMPSILIEAGFLSNKKDAEKLSSSAYRKSIAASIHKGVLEYSAKYNK